MSSEAVVEPEPEVAVAQAVVAAEAEERVGEGEENDSTENSSSSDDDDDDDSSGDSNDDDEDSIKAESAMSGGGGERGEEEEEELITFGTALLKLLKLNAEKQYHIDNDTEFSKYVIAFDDCLQEKSHRFKELYKEYKQKNPKMEDEDRRPVVEIDLVDNAIKFIREERERFVQKDVQQRKDSSSGHNSDDEDDEFEKRKPTPSVAASAMNSIDNHEQKQAWPAGAAATDGRDDEEEEKEDDTEQLFHVKKVPIQETFGYKFLNILLPEYKDDISKHLANVARNYQIGSDDALEVSKLACEIAVYIRDNSRAHCPETPQELADFVLRYINTDQWLIAVALRLVLVYIFRMWGFDDDDEDAPRRGPDETEDTVAVLIPICFKILGCHNIQKQQIQESAYNALQLVQFATRLNSVVNPADGRIIDARGDYLRSAFQNSEDEEIQFGAALCLRRIVSEGMEEAEDQGNGGVAVIHQEFLRNLQRDVLVTLRNVSPNHSSYTAFVETLLQNLRPYDDGDEQGNRLLCVEFHHHFQDNFKAILNAMTTPRICEEASRVLYFILKSSTDADNANIPDYRKPFIDLNGIPKLLNAIKLAPQSKALDILILLRGTIAPKAYADKTILQTIVATESIGAVVEAANLYTTNNAAERNVFPLCTFIFLMVHQHIRDVEDGGTVLHKMAAILPPPSETTEDRDEEPSSRKSKTLWWRLQLIDFARKKDPTADLVRDKFDRLPVHVAIQSKQSQRYIHALVAGNQSLQTELYKGLLPFQLAAQEDCDVEVINFFLRQDPSRLKDASKSPSTTSEAAPMTVARFSGDGSGDRVEDVTGDSKNNDKKREAVAESSTAFPKEGDLPKKKRAKVSEA